MTKSPEIKNLATALAKFQGAISAVKKGAENPFFKSKYADLSSIIEAIREPLSKEGLSFSQFPSGDGSLTSILMHTSGEFIEETFSMKPIDMKPQSVGSAITYMRRYALSAMLGIATEVDDDGNTASGNASQHPPVKISGARTVKPKPKSHLEEDKPPFGPGSDDAVID